VFNLDPGKLVLVAVVVIVVLGPDKLPDAARRVGATWRSFNEFRHRMESEVRQTIPDLPSSGELARLVRSPAALLDHLGDSGPETTDLPVPDAAGVAGHWISPEASSPLTSAAPGQSAGAAVEPCRPSFAAVPGDASLN
jgi:Sec-independent protein translocase protein TatA